LGRDRRQLDVDRRPLAVPDELDREARAGLGADDHTAHLLRMHDGPVADPHDDVAGFDAGALRGTVVLDGDDERAWTVRGSG
jgi:hypothetical protein